MTYTIGEISKRMNLPISTIRYYDKEGLLPAIRRTSGNTRVFDETSIEWIRLIDCLKKTGMSLKEIKQFAQWSLEADSSIEKRYQMFLNRRAEVDRQMEELQSMKKIIEWKCQYYDIAREAGTTDVPRLHNKKLGDKL